MNRAERTARRTQRDFESWKKAVERLAPGVLAGLTERVALSIFTDAYAAGEQAMENEFAQDIRDKGE